MRISLALCMLVTMLGGGLGAHAQGDERGNGGDAVVCRRPHASLRNREIMLLDLYEVRSQLGLDYDLGPADLSVESKLQLLLARVRKHDPARARTLAGYFGTFWRETLLAPNLSLPGLPDEGVVVLPNRGCKVEQLAVQTEPDLPGQPRYTIRDELWRKLDNDGRAALIFHEIVYREALLHSHRDSRRTRRLVGALAADRFAADSDHVEYGRFMWQMGFPYEGKRDRIHGTYYAADRVRYRSDGTAKRAFFERFFHFPGGNSTDFQSEGELVVDFDDREMPRRIYGREGQVFRLRAGSVIRITDRCEFLRGSLRGANPGMTEIVLDEQGRVVRVEIMRQAEIPLPELPTCYPGATVVPRDSGRFVFDFARIP